MFAFMMYIYTKQLTLCMQWNTVKFSFEEYEIPIVIMLQITKPFAIITVVCFALLLICSKK